jgi:hypothetical protein
MLIINNNERHDRIGRHKIVVASEKRVFQFEQPTKRKLARVTLQRPYR